MLLRPACWPLHGSSWGLLGPWPALTRLSRCWRLALALNVTLLLLLLVLHLTIYGRQQQRRPLLCSRVLLLLLLRLGRVLQRAARCWLQSQLLVLLLP
jgi:uncharacterized membrane protein